MAQTIQMVQSHLDALPDEILEHIIVVGGMPAVFALLPVSHRFHSICTDQTTLLKLANYQAADQKWWNKIWNGVEPTWPNLAKYLLADHKSKAVMDYDPDHSITLMLNHDILQWMPELIMSSHIICVRQGHTIKTIHPPEPIAWTSDEVHRIAFLESLLSQKLRPGLRTSIHLENYYQKESASLFRKELGMMDDAVPYRSFWRSLEQRHSLCHLFACLITGVVYEQLEIAIGSRLIQKLDQQPIMLRPPTIKDPVRTEMYLSDVVPFSKSTIPFFQEHLPTMTTKTFIESGKWVGYYSIPAIAGLPVYDAMMKDIAFNVLSESAEQCAVYGEGVDGIGEFSIFGTIDKRNGRVLLEKQYMHRHMSWPWLAYITPRGIFGTWGGEPWGGWVWLWKQDISEHND